MSSLIFDLQRFAATVADGKVTIPAGDTYALDGVTYIAINDAQLNLDDGKVSGIASGSVTANVTGKNNPVVTFDASDGAINFTATGNGEVISMTPFPIEFISGEFTYKGNTIAITAGSDLALVTQRGDFILRNENHFVTDSAYIFTSTSLTSESEHVISYFSLTNGDDVRELHLEQLGTVVNHFDQQGATLVKGSSEVLHIGDYTLTATAKDADAGLNFELGAAGMTLVPNTNAGSLNVALNRNGTEIISGELKITGGSITFGYDNAVTFAKNTSWDFTWNGYTMTATTTDEATIGISLTDKGITFTPGQNDGGVSLVLRKDGTPIFAGELNISDGSITFDATTQKFSFTEGTKIALGIGTNNAQAMDFEIVGGDASFKMAANSDGSFTITPDTGDGSLAIALKQNGTTVFQNTVTVNGSMTINPVTDLLTLANGTKVSLAFENYTMTATASGDAASTISLTANGISITPQQGDGTLNLAIGSADGSMTADIEILSGGFLFGTDGALNVVEGTELQIKFSDDYIVNFKATDAAGGALSIGTDGITFAPNTQDGGLELSITRNGQTRTASLDVTGSLTYKLDGSISLAKGTVVKNVFESGNVLTITANTDASGSIVFNPQNGLTITPSTPDALNVTLSNSDGLEVVNISSITGTINYNGGLVTASDGAQAHLLVYNIWESELRTSGGTASLQFLSDRTVYTANTGATFVLDYLDGSTLEIQNGSYSDIYATDTTDAIELISEGAIFKANDDEFVFTLEKAGNYIVNGMNITTTKDNTQVVLSGYDTVTFDADAGIVFDGQRFSGDGLITLTDGIITIVNADDNVAVNGTAFNDRITNIGDNVTINALGGNDTINSSGNGVKIDGGAGSNLVSLIGGNEGSEIVLDGVTTVKGFKTGWGNGSDTVYITEKGDPAVDFKSIGLTFYDGNDSLTLDDVDDTAKVHLYYEEIDWLRKGVFIAQNDWYEVTNSDLTVDSGEGIYFVGTSATHNHGVDFSGVSQAINVSMNTDYDAANNSIWVNNVYSIRGGAGNTTITGTADSDTIIAGRGRTTINGAGGNDRISLGSAQALVNYTSGGGSDSIYGFNANSTISIGGASYSSATSGSNLILTVGSDKVTLFGAGSLTNPHIVGTLAGGSSNSSTSGGSSTSTTSGGSSNSSTSGGSSNSSTSGGSSTSTTSGGSSTSTTSGGSSTSTTSGGSSTSTTSGGSSTSTTSGGSSTSTTSGGSSTSTTSGGSSSVVRSTGNSELDRLLGITPSTTSGGTSETSTTDENETVTPTTTASAVSYIYTGGDSVIEDYESGEKIALGTYPTSGSFVDGDFVLNSGSGSLIVEDATDKVVEFVDGAGNAFIKAYEATNAGVIDGRGIAGFELITGSEGNDWIYAGDGGSQLWGGSGTASDLLTGGNGTDIFIAGKNQGADVIENAETKDEVHLNDATLSDIVATAENNGLIAITFNNGNSIAIRSTEALGAAIILSDNSKYRYNHATKAWQSA